MGRRMLGHDRLVEDVRALEAELGRLRERTLSVAYFVEGNLEDDPYEASRTELVDQVTAVGGRIAGARYLEASALPDGAQKGFDELWDGASRDERRVVM